MRLGRILGTTPFRRFALAMIPLLVVDLILAPISIFGGAPPIRGVVQVNFLVILILVFRFGILFLKRLWCRSCGKGMGKDTGKDDHGYPVVRCPKCDSRWIL